MGGLGKNWRALPQGVRKGLAFKLFKLFKFWSPPSGI